jgi:hypothetical protein
MEFIKKTKAAVSALAFGVALLSASTANAMAVKATTVSDVKSRFGSIHHKVPAVPEADTWAMMAVGLGLIGMRLGSRRKM